MKANQIGSWAHRGVLGTLAAGFLAAAAIGCGGATTPEAESSKVEATAQPAAAKGEGFGAAIADSLRAVELRADQKSKVAAIEATLREDAEPVRAARKDVASTLADGVARGALDEKTMGTKIDALGQAAGAMAPHLQSALDQLHATLDAGQRKALVAELRTHAHDQRGDRREHMKKVAEDLGLTSEQKSAVKDAFKAEMKAHGEDHLAGMKKAKERMTAIATAFEGDTFDAKSIGVGDHLTEMAKNGATRIVKVTGVLLPTLSQAQRDKLATIIRERAEKLD